MRRRALRSWRQPGEAPVSGVMASSKHQLDKLGQRLARGPISDEDLRLLHEYRLTFAAISALVIRSIEALGLELTARTAKSTQAIVDKLLREKVRLTQIQDIAGCRVRVKTLSEQELLASQLLESFPGSRLHDRVTSPSHAYRAKHVVVKADGQCFEVQVRTELQHLWAEMSEKAADHYGHGVKYGKGNSVVQAKLSQLSDLVYDTDLRLDLLELLRGRTHALGSDALRSDFHEAELQTVLARRALQIALEQFANEPRDLVSSHDLPD